MAYFSALDKIHANTFKALKTSNTRLIGVYHKIIYRFCLFVNVHMPGCIAGHLATARQHEKAFCASKLKRLHAYFFTRLIKAVLYHFIYLVRAVFVF